MKRTKVMNKERFRKGFVLASVVASSFALAGCEVADETVKMYQTVDQCQTLDGADSSAQCKASFEQAKAEHDKAGPKFESASDCAAEFGTCEYNGGSGSFMPMMAGFMMGQMMGNMQANSNFRAASPMYQNKDGKYTDIKRNSYNNIMPGKSFGTYKSTMAKQPTSTAAKAGTVSRGGFGSSVRGSSGG